jgi:hypothetical protein
MLQSSWAVEWQHVLCVTALWEHDLCQARDTQGQGMDARDCNAPRECTLSGLQMLSKTWSSRAEVLGMSGGRVRGDIPSSTFPDGPSVASSPNRATSSSLSEAKA